MGKELQTLFEEGGCENLVITTKEGKKKSYKPSRMIKLFFFFDQSVEILLPTPDSL